MSTFHHRRSSDELDVFEAAWYFSEFNEVATTKKEEEKEENSLEDKLHLVAVTVSKFVEQEKCSQPTSSGGRLVRILNNFFNQGKKKSKLARISSNNSYSSSSSSECKGNQQIPRKYAENIKRFIWHVAPMPRITTDEKTACGLSEEDAGSDSSSDLFELQNYDLNWRGYSQIATTVAL